MGIAQIDLDLAWILLSDGFCEMFGYTPDELRQKTFLDITHPDSHEAYLVAMGQLLAGEISSYSAEKQCVHKDGTTFWVRLFTSVARDLDNLLRGFIVVAENVTPTTRADRAVREMEQRLKLVQRAAQVGVWDLDLRTNEVVRSGEYLALYGLQPDHPPLGTEEWLKLVHPDDRGRILAHLRQSLETTHFWDTEFRVIWPDGSVHWLLAKGTVILDDSGQPARLTGFNFDITERKESESALRESEERFRNMAHTAPVMIWVSGPDTRCTFFNKRWLSFTGRTLDQIIGNGWISGIHHEDREAFLAKYSASSAAREEFQTSFRLRRADGEYRWVLTTGAPRFTTGGAFAGYVGSCVDISDLRRAQDEALARQKLESIGVLAGGIAHDFNNLLAGVLAEAELAAAELEQGESPLAGIQRIELAARRGAEIVRELMIYAGQDNTESLDLPLDLSCLVEEMLELLKVSISKQTALKTYLPRNLPAVSARASQIRQIVMNLIVNASEAIGDNGGVIKVTTGRTILPRASAPNSPPNLPSGEYLILKVSDTGGGMTEEVQAKVFDPFFSTKFAGRGLGLAVVQGIVRDHGGAIHLISAPGQGASFEVFLPCAGEAAPLHHYATAPAPGREDGVREGTVLVVEDEGVLRVALSRMLQKNGFAVIEAGDGSSALDLVRTHKDEIDVMLLDITLPGVSSREVFEQTRHLRPNLKVILTSAYGREAVNASFQGLPIERFIRKPFQFVDLMGLIQDALSR